MDLRFTCCPCRTQEYQRLLGSQPGRRLNPSRLVDNAVLHNKLVDITASLENLSVKVRHREKELERGDSTMCKVEARPRA